MKFWEVIAAAQQHVPYLCGSDTAIGEGRSCSCIAYAFLVQKELPYMILDVSILSKYIINFISQICVEPFPEVGRIEGCEFGKAVQ